MGTPEVRNGAFIFRDAFFVEVAEGKRHPRAPVSELREFLLPKKSIAPLKDQVGHWYEAQLIHYGLPRTKDKNTAKVRLTGALTSGSLAVPSYVLGIEADLKRMYAGALRKAKLASAKRDIHDLSVTSPGKKRKASDFLGSPGNGSNTKISVRVGDVAVEVDRQTCAGERSAAKRQKATPKSRRAIPKKAETYFARTSSMSPAKSSYSRAIASGGDSRPKQTARKSQPFSSPSRGLLFAGRPSPSSQETVYGDESPPPYTSFTSNGDMDSGRDDTQFVQISGIYSITTSATDNEGQLSFRLFSQRDQAWGRFTIDDKIGVIRLDHIEGLADSMRKSFSWRIEDLETGKFRFGKGCDGWIEFNGNGGVRGNFCGLEMGSDVEFDGSLGEHFGYEYDDERALAVREIEAQWYEIADRAYGRV